MVSLFKWIPKLIKRMQKNKKTINEEIAKAVLSTGLLLGTVLILSKALDSPEISQDQTGIVNVHSQGINAL